MKFKVKFIQNGQQLTGIFPSFTDYQIWRVQQQDIQVVGMESMSK
jgi:hypothetical protein